jgi:hypothetical protein
MEALGSSETSVLTRALADVTFRPVFYLNARRFGGWVRVLPIGRSRTNGMQFRSDKRGIPSAQRSPGVRCRVAGLSVVAWRDVKGPAFVSRRARQDTKSGSACRWLAERCGGERRQTGSRVPAGCHAWVYLAAASGQPTKEAIAAAETVAFRDYSDLFVSQICDEECAWLV